MNCVNCGSQMVNEGQPSSCSICGLPSTNANEIYDLLAQSRRQEAQFKQLAAATTDTQIAAACLQEAYTCHLQAAHFQPLLGYSEARATESLVL